ncbi:SGNH/GDSL hydrolase family protein [Streptomyces sp. NBC_01275]|uniref:SGNH/GDSL hydrolase family protein n=1 Tax=Streptomyces sp. NBC_01275 TaxID=2903807 RepID=UPI002258794C|nr:SGNH/GDSL hydrolase family protein [Streptomyces sp. NBC_01275]MCX4763970.1 SGNH/GDSL hydrolase family protein [Streptomyces sp. NBC_01275]
MTDEDFSAEAADPHCVSPAESDALLASAPWKRLAVFGDSAAEGLGQPVPGYRTIPWGERLRDSLARVSPGLEYANFGRRGLLSGQIREQQLERVLEFAPDLACLVAGGNDAFAPRFSPDEVEETIDGIVSALRASGSDVLLFGLMDASAALPELRPGRSRMIKLNAAVRAVAERHDGVFVDLWEHPARADADMYSDDKIHNSMRGHAAIAADTIRALSRRIGS